MSGKKAICPFCKEEKTEAEWSKFNDVCLECEDNEELNQQSGGFY